MKKSFVSVVLSATMILSLAACGGSKPAETTAAPAAPAETTAAAAETTEAAAETTAAAAETTAAAASSDVYWMIGGIGPCTGGAAAYGLSCKEALEIAVEEINENGGINGYQIKYQFEDDEHDAEKSVNAYNTLKDWGMQALVGCTTSSPCIAVIAESVNDNMFQITPSGSAEDCISTPNAFAVCFSDPQQGMKSAEFIGTHELAKKVGILYDASDVYSSGIHDTFVAEAANQGLEIVADEQFTSDNKTDFTIQLQNIQNAGAELVFLPFYYTEATLVLNQAKGLGMDVKYFGCDGMDGILNVEGFDKSLAEGLMLLTPFAADADDELTQSFVKKYQEKFGQIPLQFGADAYDGLYAIKLAAEKADLNPTMSVEEIGTGLEKAITEIELKGLTGTITWDASGSPSKEPKAVIIENGAYKSMED